MQKILTIILWSYSSTIEDKSYNENTKKYDQNVVYLNLDKDTDHAGTWVSAMDLLSDVGI